MRRDQQLERDLADVRRRLAALERLLAPPAPAGPEARTASGAAPGWTGQVRHGGEVTRAGGEGEIRWDRSRPAEELLQRDPGRVAATLAALASPVRHAMVRALLDEPRSTRELQAMLGLSSQGHTHYHVKELMAAGLVRQRDRGRYALDPAAVIPYLVLLSACADLEQVAGEPGASAGSGAAGGGAGMLGR